MVIFETWLPAGNDTRLPIAAFNREPGKARDNSLKLVMSRPKADFNREYLAQGFRASSLYHSD